MTTSKPSGDDIGIVEIWQKTRHVTEKICMYMVGCAGSCVNKIPQLTQTELHKGCEGPLLVTVMITLRWSRTQFFSGSFAGERFH